CFDPTGSRNTCAPVQVQLVFSRPTTTGLGFVFSNQKSLHPGLWSSASTGFTAPSALGSGIWVRGNVSCSRSPALVFVVSTWPSLPDEPMKLRAKVMPNTITARTTAATTHFAAEDAGASSAGRSGAVVTPCSEFAVRTASEALAGGEFPWPSGP